MSQQEFEQNDQEVMGVVNGHSHPDAEAAAEEIAAGEWFPETEEKADFSASGCRSAVEMTGAGCEPDVPDEDAEVRERFGKAEKLYQKQKRIETLKAVLFVAACIVIAAALVAAWYVPGMTIWVINFGVLICGIAAALKIDKYVRWWR